MYTCNNHKNVEGHIYILNATICFDIHIYSLYNLEPGCICTRKVCAPIFAVKTEKNNPSPPPESFIHNEYRLPGLN